MLLRSKKFIPAICFIFNINSKCEILCTSTSAGVVAAVTGTAGATVGVGHTDCLGVSLCDGVIVIVGVGGGVGLGLGLCDGRGVGVGCVYADAGAGGPNVRDAH